MIFYFLVLTVELRNAVCASMWEVCLGKSLKQLPKNIQRQNNGWEGFKGFHRQEICQKSQTLITS